MDRLLVHPWDFCPQPGPQQDFLSSPADICIYGGAAGGGKSWAVIYEPLRHIHRPGFTALIMRRFAVDITAAGGLWSEAAALYPLLGGTPNQNKMEWRFPSGATIKFGSIDHDYKKRFQGAQIACLIFDELTHFEWDEFVYLISRNRTTCGIRPYVRGTCNPDADSWLAPFLQWWWDPETGLPIGSRAGRVRWMVRRGDDLYWAPTQQELLRRHPWAFPAQSKSVAFVPARLEDNRFLGDDYRANLYLQDEVQQARLISGNWLARYTKGKIFQRQWFKFVEDAPRDTRWIRAWDLAATAEKDAESSTSYTAGVLIGVSPGTGGVYVGDLVYGRWDSGDVEDQVLKTAGARPADDRQPDGRDVPIWFCRERAGAGKSLLGHYVRLLKGYEADGDVETGEKAVRLGPLAAQAKAGNVYLVRSSEWNARFIRAMENLPARPDDVGDAAAAGFARLVEVEDPTELAQALAEDQAHAAEIGRAYDFSGAGSMESW